MSQQNINLVSGRGDGVTHWFDIFTSRQLVALTTFSDLVGEARGRVLADARNADLCDGLPVVATWHIRSQNE